MRVLVLTGAGVSAESGIPTFRGKDGYWRNLDPTKLATPEAFARDPQLVWDWYRERRQRIRNARPNAAHEAIAQIGTTHGRVPARYAERGRPARARWCGGRKDGANSRRHFRYALFALRLWTQVGAVHPNRPALVSFNPREAIEVNRRYLRTRCSSSKLSKVPALMRPGVVWFGEQLSRNELERVEDFLDGGACDVVIVAGTTATFGYIIDWALRGSRDGAELIEVNPEETPLSRFATRLVREPAAIALPRIVDGLIGNW